MTNSKDERQGEAGMRFASWHFQGNAFGGVLWHIPPHVSGECICGEGPQEVDNWQGGGGTQVVSVGRIKP